jgi:hypothetical protein
MIINKVHLNTARAASKDKGRPSLTFLKIHADKEKETVTSWATDSFIAIRQTEHTNLNVESEMRFLTEQDRKKQAIEPASKQDNLMPLLHHTVDPNTNFPAFDALFPEESPMVAAVSVNVEYLINVLSAIKKDKWGSNLVKISLFGSTRPMVLEATRGKVDFKAMVMPVRTD